MRLQPAAEKAVRNGHPWVYADRIRGQNREGKPGEIAVIYDRRDRFLAAGLYDPDSPIRVRVLQANSPATIDAAWFDARLDAALKRRRGRLPAGTDGYRIINGESDGWPGLVLDAYRETRVAKLYTRAWKSWLPLLVDRWQTRWPNERLVLRLSRNVQETPSGNPGMNACGEPKPSPVLPWSDGVVLRGDPVSGPVIFSEAGLNLEADVLHGQKTGFFLDQRDNRMRVGELASGGELLNVFSFSGGFSVHAARGGARRVADVDISAHALQSARRNFALNRGHPAVGACVHETIQANAFDWLARTPDRAFDTIVLDPPSMAKRKSERAGALQAYGVLVRRAADWLRPDGILVAASCSAHVEAQAFFEVVLESAAKSGGRFNLLETHRHAIDHPADIPEAEYLKAVYLRKGRAGG